MCGRFTLVITPEIAAALFGLEQGLGMESYNIAPTTEVPVVTQHGNLRTMQQQRFGFLPFYAKDAKEGARSNNARIETIAEKPAFSKALQERRCVIPASGFYEWADGKVKQPWYFSSTESSHLAFGGIWSHWKRGDHDFHSFAILTIPPHPVVAAIHDRSPLMLGDHNLDRWLDNRSVDAAFLGDATARSHALPLSAWPVDRRVGNVRSDDAGLIEPMIAEPPSAAPVEARMD